MAHHDDHDHERRDLQPADAEEEIGIAEQALEDDDFAHAAQHVAGALAVDPTRREWRDLLDRIADLAPDVDDLLPLDGGVWFGHAAGRGHVLAHVGRVQEALDIVGQVAAHMPSSGYGSWVAEWLRRHPGPLDLSQLMIGLVGVGEGTIGFLRLRPTERALVQPWADVALALLERSGDEGLPQALAISSGVLRRVGLVDEAARAARRSMELLPNPWAASALGLALRARGEWDAAVEAFRAAGRLDDSYPIRAEVARVHLDAGRLADAERELEAERITDDDPELTAMRAWVRVRLRGDTRPAGFFRRLFAKKDPWLEDVAKRIGERADADLFRQVSIFGVVHPPSPTDATANVVRQLAGKPADGPISVSVTTLEAPSNRLALALAAGVTDLATVAYRFGDIPEPDPRLPRRPVRDVVWMYRGPEKRDVIQVLPAPEKDVRRAVDAIAGTPYLLPRWWAAARQAGPALGPSAVDELLGAMVHPPLTPVGMNPVDWVFQRQLAAAFLLAHVDDGWEGSRRREVLFSLVDGVMDWTTEVAIIALTELALDEPLARREIEARLWALREEVPTPGHGWFAETLAWCYLRLPGTPRDRRSELEQALEAIHGEGSGPA